MLENQLDEKIQLLSKTTDISKITEYQKQINDIVTKKSKIIWRIKRSWELFKTII